jgi:glycosyltransferase involved in cell wall biosynthesis
LKNRPNVILHDFLSDPEARHVIQAADLVICTSHDEGLGLSLLEVQFGGLPVVAPDKPIFREVLGSSGIFIDIQSPKNAADRIAGALGVDGWREQYIASSTSNLERWNELADSDHGSVISFLTRLIPPN